MVLIPAWMQRRHILISLIWTILLFNAGVTGEYWVWGNCIEVLSASFLSLSFEQSNYSPWSMLSPISSIYHSKQFLLFMRLCLLSSVVYLLWQPCWHSLCFKRRLQLDKEKRASCCGLLLGALGGCAIREAALFCSSPVYELWLCKRWILLRSTLICASFHTIISLNH